MFICNFAQICIEANPVDDSVKSVSVSQNNLRPIFCKEIRRVITENTQIEDIQSTLCQK